MSVGVQHFAIYKIACASLNRFESLKLNSVRIAIPIFFWIHIVKRTVE